MPDGKLVKHRKDLETPSGIADALTECIAGAPNVEEFSDGEEYAHTLLLVMFLTYLVNRGLVEGEVEDCTQITRLYTETWLEYRDDLSSAADDVILEKEEELL